MKNFLLGKDEKCKTTKMNGRKDRETDGKTDRETAKCECEKALLCDVWKEIDLEFFLKTRFYLSRTYFFFLYISCHEREHFHFKENRLSFPKES